MGAVRLPPLQPVPVWSALGEQRQDLETLLDQQFLALLERVGAAADTLWERAQEALTGADVYTYSNAWTVDAIRAVLEVVRRHGFAKGKGIGGTSPAGQLQAPAGNALANAESVKQLLAREAVPRLMAIPTSVALMFRNGAGGGIGAPSFLPLRQRRGCGGTRCDDNNECGKCENQKSPNCATQATAGVLKEEGLLKCNNCEWRCSAGNDCDCDGCNFKNLGGCRYEFCEPGCVYDHI
jgi:hypothetical protein